MNLYYELYPENISNTELVEQSPMVIIPGLFGSTANWRMLARKFSESQPVIVIDQRNHGRSPHADSQSYDDMVADLNELYDSLIITNAILCGHSMGGKVAMLFSLKYPEKVKKLIVLDIAPTAYNHSHAPFLEELMKVDLSELKSRSEADRALQSAIPDTPTRLFLLQSLRGSPGDYHWRINLSVLHEYMDQFTSFPLVGNSTSCESLFVAGELSNYLLLEHRAKIIKMFPNTQFENIPNAGHWLHAEQPVNVFNAVQEFVKK